MNSSIHFVIRIEKNKDWLHQQHAWSIPLLKIPGTRLIEVRHEGELIKRSAYRVDYKKLLLLGQGVQHFDTLFVQFCFTRRLSTWNNVMLSGIAGLAGMLFLFFISFVSFTAQESLKTSRKDSIRAEQGEFSSDSIKPAPVSRQRSKALPPSQSYISNTAAINDPAHREIIVAIGAIPDSAGVNGNPSCEDPGEGQDISAILERKQYVPSSSFFTSSIYTNGIFQQIMGANFSRAPLASLRARADELCIGTVWRHTHSTISQKNMFVAEIQLRIRFFSLQNGVELRHYDKTITSPAAFTPEQALTEANDALKKFLNDTL